MALTKTRLLKHDFPVHGKYLGPPPPKIPADTLPAPPPPPLMGEPPPPRDFHFDLFRSFGPFRTSAVSEFQDLGTQERQPAANLGSALPGTLSTPSVQGVFF